MKAIDLDENALKNLSNNIGADIYKMDLSKFGDQHTVLLNDVDVLVAGPPCQGFSTAGRNDPDDYRNNHLWNVARIAGLVRPKVVVIENVRGLLTHKNSKHFNKTISMLRESGYSVDWGTYNLTDYSVPQSRVRVLIVAVLSDQNYELQIPCSERVSIKAALNGVEKVKDFSKKFLCSKSDELQIAKRISPGQKLSNVRSGLSSVHTWEIPEVFGKVTDLEAKLLETLVKLRRQNRRRTFGDADPVAIDEIQKFFGNSTFKLLKSLVEKKYVRRVNSHIDLTNTFNGKFRRLKWDDVSPTVDTRFGQPRYFLHPEDHRGISVREAARIQGFPDTFHFSGSDAAKYRMIGNAVPPIFAKLIATHLKENWSKI